MALFIDTDHKVPVDLGGEFIFVRVLTGRQGLALARIGVKINKLVSTARERTPGEDDPDFTEDEALDAQALNFKILELGLDLPVDMIDRIPAKHWPFLVGEVFRVNRLTKDDEGNLPSG